MIEQMSVGIKLTLGGDASPKLKLFLKDLQSVTKANDALNLKLKATSEAFQRLSAVLSGTSAGFREFTGSSGMARDAISGFSRSISTGSASLSRFNNSLHISSVRMANAARSAMLLKESVGGIGGGFGGGRGHGGGGIHTHPLSMGGFSFNPMTVAGAAIGIPAYLDYKAFGAYGRFQQAQAQFAMQGFGSQANTQATSLAINSQLRGISSTEMMSAINDAATVTRNPQQAFALAPVIAKMAFANKNLYSMQGQNFTQQDEMRLLRFAELKTGSTDPNKIIPTLNLLEKGFTSESARLRPTDLFTFSKLGASFISQLSDTGFAAMFPLIQSLGGARAGTGFYTLQTSLEKGQNLRTGKKAVQELIRLGISEKSGRVKSKFLPELTADPVGFISDVLMPSYTRAGITSLPQITAETNKLFTQTAARVILQTIEQAPRIAASRALVPKAAGVQTAYTQSLNTNIGSMHALSTAFDSFSTALGKLTNPANIAGINALTDLFLGLTSGINKLNAFTGSKFLSSLLHPISSGMAAGEVAGQPHAKSGTATSSSNQSRNLIMNVDGRTLAQILMPHIDYGSYLAQIGTSASQNPRMASNPIIPSNTALY